MNEIKDNDGHPIFTGGPALVLSKMAAQMGRYNAVPGEYGHAWVDVRTLRAWSDELRKMAEFIGRYQDRLHEIENA